MNRAIEVVALGDFDVFGAWPFALCRVFPDEFGRVPTVGGFNFASPIDFFVLWNAKANHNASYTSGSSTPGTDDYDFTHASSPATDINFDGADDIDDALTYSAATNYELTYNRKLYAGYDWDPALQEGTSGAGMYHVRHRVLMSELGRWSRRDPVGYVGEVSLFAYDTNDPLDRVDPSGLASCDSLRTYCSDSQGNRSDFAVLLSLKTAQDTEEDRRERNIRMCKGEVRNYIRAKCFLRLQNPAAICDDATLSACEAQAKADGESCCDQGGTAGECTGTARRSLHECEGFVEPGNPPDPGNPPKYDPARPNDWWLRMYCWHDRCGCPGSGEDFTSLTSCMQVARCLARGDHASSVLFLRCAQECCSNPVRRVAGECLNDCLFGRYPIQ